MRKGGMRLRPNTSYEVRGAATSKMTSDAAGNASVMTVLDGRTALHVTPVPT